MVHVASYELGGCGRCLALVMDAGVRCSNAQHRAGILILPRQLSFSGILPAVSPKMVQIYQATIDLAAIDQIDPSRNGARVDKKMRKKRLFFNVRLIWLSGVYIFELLGKSAAISSSGLSV